MRDSTDEDKINQFLEIVDNRRIGMPGEIASLINFLISDKSNHITGQDISIDGGI
jgi:NAD(P)-dependent dehydrogenase (short-subunit alcohol dehydrogenase family)